MKKNEIIELLEKEFVNSINEFDKTFENKSYYNKKAQEAERLGHFGDMAYYRTLAERMETERTAQATISTKLVEMLAKIDDISFDDKNEQLFKKYNLYNTLKGE